MFEDDEEDQNHQSMFHKDVTLVMDAAKEPIDICWYNMGGTYGLYYWWRFILLLISFIIIVFFSTPSAVLAAVKWVDILNLAKSSEGLVKYYIPVVGNSIVRYFPPLMVMFVN